MCGPADSRHDPSSRAAMHGRSPNLSHFVFASFLGEGARSVIFGMLETWKSTG